MVGHGFARLVPRPPPLWLIILSPGMSFPMQPDPTWPKPVRAHLCTSRSRWELPGWWSNPVLVLACPGRSPPCGEVAAFASALCMDAVAWWALDQWNPFS